MSELHGSYVLGAMLGLLLLGLAAVVAARGGGRVRHVLWQRLFLACLVGTSAISAAAIQIGGGGWLSCAVLLPVMVLGAIVDLDGTRAQSPI